jgi:hypothetical protein
VAGKNECRTDEVSEENASVGVDDDTDGNSTEEWNEEDGEEYDDTSGEVDDEDDSEYGDSESL